MSAAALRGGVVLLLLLCCQALQGQIHLVGFLHQLVCLQQLLPHVPVHFVAVVLITLLRCVLVCWLL